MTSARMHAVYVPPRPSGSTTINVLVDYPHADRLDTAHGLIEDALQSYKGARSDGLEFVVTNLLYGSQLLARYVYNLQLKPRT